LSSNAWPSGVTLILRRTGKSELPRSPMVRPGMEGPANRKRDFFKKLKENLANDAPKDSDRMVDEFRGLILGR